MDCFPKRVPHAAFTAFAVISSLFLIIAVLVAGSAGQHKLPQGPEVPVDIRAEPVNPEGRSVWPSSTNLTQTHPLSASDWSGDGDGYPEPGEFVTVRFHLTNNTGLTAMNVRVTLVGGGSVSYGNLPNGYARSGEIPITIPAAAACANDLPLTFNVTSSLGKIQFVRPLFLGKPQTSRSTENFDAAAVLPTGWATASDEASFAIVTTVVDSGTNALGVDAATAGRAEAEATSPRVAVGSSGPAIVSFRNRYRSESNAAGGVLEISIAGGDFRDFLAAGGSFEENGYDAVLPTNSGNPLAGLNAWTGDSAGYRTTRARFPASAAGKLVRLRFRFGTAGSPAPANWRIDTLSLTNASIVTSYSCSLVSDLRSKADFDSDGKTDLAIFRTSDRTFWINRSTRGHLVVQLGAPGSIPVVADYDGDRTSDVAIWNPFDATWLWISSRTGMLNVMELGRYGDIPQPADIDGDGKADVAVFRPADGTWSFYRSGEQTFGYIQFGQFGDIPTIGDYDGDGKADLSVFRPSGALWYRINSSNGQERATYFGLPSDIPVNADFDGDSKEDIGVFRADGGTFFYESSNSGATIGLLWGGPGDVPLAGDFNADGKADVAVFRQGEWFVHHLDDTFDRYDWGLPSDTPVTQKPFPFYSPGN